MKYTVVRGRFPDFHQEVQELLSSVMIWVEFAHCDHHINNYYKSSRRCVSNMVILCVRKFQKSNLQDAWIRRNKRKSLKWMLCNAIASSTEMAGESSAAIPPHFYFAIWVHFAEESFPCNVRKLLSLHWHEWWALGYVRSYISTLRRPFQRLYIYR